MSTYKNISRMSGTGLNRPEGLRADFRCTLEASGHLHVVRIADRTKRCSCIALRDNRHNEPDPNCEICDSIGFLYVDDERLARKSYEAGPEQAAAPQRMRVSEMAFYVEHDVFKDRKEAEYSRIMELEMDDYGNPVPGNKVIAKYDIKDASPYSEKGVRIYWKLTVSRKDV